MSKPQFDRSPIQFDWVQDYEQFVDYEAEINGLRLRLTWCEVTARWGLSAVAVDTGTEYPCGQPTKQSMIPALAFMHEEEWPMGCGEGNDA